MRNSKKRRIFLALLSAFFINLSLVGAVSESSSHNITISGTGNKYTEVSFCGEKIDKSDTKTGSGRGESTDKNQARIMSVKSRNAQIANLQKQGATIISKGAPSCSWQAISNSSAGGSSGGKPGTSYGGGGKNTNIPSAMSTNSLSDYKIEMMANNALRTAGCYCCGSGVQGCINRWFSTPPSANASCAYVDKSMSECTGQNKAKMGYVCNASFSYTTSVATTGIAQLPTGEYKSNSSDFANISEDAYCLQQGRRGPDGKTIGYTALDNFDISTCGNGGDSYQCGLAEIMCQTMDYDFTDGKLSATNNGKFSYASVATALRMWVAYDHASIHDGSGVSTADGAGSEHFDYYSSTDVYLNSANYYLNGGGTIEKCKSNCSKNSSNYGVLCYNNDTEKANIENILKLLESSKNGMSCLDKLNQSLNSTGDGELSYGTPGVSIKFDKNSTTAKVSTKFKDMKIGTTLVEETKENVEVPVKYCDKADAGCTVVIQVFDAYGNELKPEGGIPSSCKKNFCEIKYSYKQICTQLNQKYQDNYLRVKVTVYSGGSGNGGAGAIIKNYVNASGEVTQQFVGFDIEGLQNLSNGNSQGNGSGNGSTTETLPYNGKVYEKKGTPVCPCESSGKNKRCDDFEVKKSLPGYCTNYDDFNKGIYDTYDEGKVEEPYMNCIMNACNVSQRNQYDFSDEYKVDKSICRVFCREEIEFYMANKTRVYAGMQFRYQIERVLGSKRKLNNNNNLTAMVLQKRQCSTEIYYDHLNPRYNYEEVKETWLDRYNKAVQEMLDAWNEWKFWEALHIKVGWRCLKPSEGKISPGGTCTKGDGTCGGSCSNGATLTDVKYIYNWPVGGGSVSYTKSNGSGFKTNKISEQTNDKLKFNVRNRDSSASASSGTENQFSKCSSGSGCNCSKVTDPKTGKSKTVCSSNISSTSDSCVQGVKGDPCYVQSMELSTRAAFKSKLDAVTQLVYGLENCNLYSTDNLSLYYNTVTYQGYGAGFQGSYTPAIDGGTTKDYIFKLANCKSEKNCISLEVDYDDAKYGEKTTFGKEVEVITQSDDIKHQAENAKYCINEDRYEKASGNDYSASCYPGDNSEADIDLVGDTVKGNHDWLYCTGYQTNAKCYKDYNGKAQLPMNDFAVFTVVSEADFWQPKTYTTEAYTGTVNEGTSGSGNSANLGSYVFPVSMDTTSGQTGAYNIRQRFSYVGSALSKTGILNENYYEFTCQYEVYNITNLYDCELSNETNGNVDLSSCNNKCYEIRDGVPIILEDIDRCSNWSKITPGKKYGFIYRNVNLGKLFPANRKIGTNWSNNPVIEEIESTNTDMYSNGNRYLEYSYILTSDAIKKIKTYNKNRNGAGGYIDNSLRGCTISDGFYNCSSTFLDLFRDDSNSFGIKVNKSDGVSPKGMGE